MSTQKNLITLCFAAVFTLGLAACGGGGGGGEPPPVTPEPVDRVDDTVADMPDDTVADMPDDTVADMPDDTVADMPDDTVEPVEPMDTVELGAAQTAAMDAANAAKTASNNAAAEVAGAAASQDADTSSYTLARIAAQDAMESYMAAKAASDAAAATEDTAVAQAQQAIAEARQADAEVALAEAMRLAGVVAMAQQALDDAETERMALDTARMDAETERMALDTARMEAMAAANAAKDAYEAAKMAVAAVEANQGSDQDSYDVAKAAEMAAHEAYMDAKSASDAAAMATSSADAEMYRNTAQEKQEDAETAQGNAMTHAGMVSTAHTEATDLALAKMTEATDLALAKMKADEAAGAAEVAHTRARVAAEEVATRRPGSTEASSAESAAVNAQIAAALARNASDRAQTAMVSGDAEDEQLRAEAFKTSAERYRETATTIETAVIDGDDETGKLTMARGGAVTAYEKAKRIAMEARQAADDVATLLGDTNDSATAAAADAQNAEDARDAAMRESMDAATASDSETAAGHRTEAERQQGLAQTALESANHYLTLARIGVGAAETQGIAAAARESKKHADSAQQHYEDAKGKAALAQGAVDRANRAVTKATRARTDVTGAKVKLMAAMTARDTANTAVTAAMNAAAAAETARQGAVDATTLLDAEAKRDEAERQDGIAEANHMGPNGAGMMYMAARDAADEAETAAATHVLALFKAANAVSETDLDNRAVAVEAVTTAIDAAAKIAGNGGTDSMAVVTWAVDTPAAPDATPPTEVVPGAFRIDVTTVSGADALAFNLKAVAADPDAIPAIVAMVRTATPIDGLPGFTHGYSISSGGTSAIVFTDKVQGAGPVLAVDAVTARYVADEAVTMATELRLGTDRAGPTYTDVTWTPSDEAALTGTLSCSTGGCDIEVNADGTITSIEGYVFTGSRDAVAGVTAADAMEDNDYLAFGVWLMDAVEETEPSVGAFADSELPNFATPTNLYGTAKYTGSATGLYTAGSSVDYFQGRASLTANFGDTPDEGLMDVAPGTVTGMIDRIVAGGNSMSDEISLRSADVMVNGAFGGYARMGAGVIQDDDTVEYPYTGMWSGQFYGAAAEANETATTTPAAAAGTFGVTGTMGEGENAVTRSYLGAFGARKSD